MDERKASGGPLGCGPGCVTELCVYGGIAVGLATGRVEGLPAGLIGGCILASLVILRAIRRGQRTL